MRTITGLLITATLLITGAAGAQESELQPMSSDAMSQTRINENESGDDRDELSKDEIEELQQYLRDQPESARSPSPPRQRRQEDDSGNTPFGNNFRDAMRDATRGQRSEYE